MFTLLKRISLFLVTNLAVLVLLGGIYLLLQHFFPELISQHGDLTSMLLFAALFGFGGSIISLLISRWQAKRSYNITLLSKDQLHTYDTHLQGVYATVERIAHEKGINMPEVGYYESPEPNAFATGATKNSALVAVSTGLLDSMTASEIEGVIGHEMAHILNGDMVTLTLITGVLNTFVILLSQILARFIASFLARGEENEGISHLSYSVVSIVLQIIFGMLASLVIMWFSRIREYRADIGGSELTGKKHMIAALKKLKKLSSKNDVMPKDGNLAAFMITEGDSAFSTHPSLENRIQKLEENYMLP